jgi:drug/metabolite transporter (DMT)-like permease
MPAWTAVLAILILGERLNHGRAVMLAVGLVGYYSIRRESPRMGGAGTRRPSPG